MEWIKADDPELLRFSDGGRYLLQNRLSKNGAVQDYRLWRLEYIGSYPSAEAATESIMTRTGPMSGR